MTSLGVVRDRAEVAGRIGVVARGTAYGLAGLIARFVPSRSAGPS